MLPISSLMMFLWYQGGRNECSATIQRSRNSTKSMLAVPGWPDGAVSTVKIDGSGWSNRIAPTGRIGREVVFVGAVVAVPGDDVERRMVDRRFVELAAPFDDDAGVTSRSSKAATGALEVARIGQAVGADRAAMRQVEFLAVVLADEAARRAVEQFDAVDQAARDQRDFPAARRSMIAELGAEAQPAFLRHDQQFAIGRIEIFVAPSRR